LAYLVLNDISFDVAGITVNNTSNGGGIQGHYDEAYRVLSFCNMQEKHEIYKGATKNFEEIKGSINQETFDGSEAVNFIIETARGMKDEKLVLILNWLRFAIP
jgi:purine nucleosidase